jgi:hypothetical protein
MFTLPAIFVASENFRGGSAPSIHPNSIALSSVLLSERRGPILLWERVSVLLELRGSRASPRFPTSVQPLAA